jgi:hypothetical protein
MLVRAGIQKNGFDKQNPPEIKRTNVANALK